VYLEECAHCSVDIIRLSLCAVVVLDGVLSSLDVKDFGATQVSQLQGLEKMETYLWKNLLNFSASRVALMMTTFNGLLWFFPFAF